MRGVILEGIPGTRKTTLLRALMTGLGKMHYGSLWTATEHLTDRLLEPHGSATKVKARKIQNEHISLLKKLSSLEKRSSSNSKKETIYIIERFHISISIHVHGITLSDFLGFEKTLLKYDPILIWLYLDKEKILSKSVENTLRERDMKWRNYLQMLGKTHKQQANHFIAEQNKFNRLYQESILCKRCFNVTEQKLELIYEEIMRHLVNNT